MIWKQLSLSMNPLDFRLRSRQWMRRQGKGRRPYGWGDVYGRITKGAARRAASLQLEDAAVETCENGQAARMGRRPMLGRRQRIWRKCSGGQKKKGFAGIYSRRGGL